VTRDERDYRPWLDQGPTPPGVGPGLRAAAALLVFTPLAFQYLPQVSRIFSWRWAAAAIFLQPARQLGLLADAEPFSRASILADVIYCALIALLLDFALRRLSRAAPGSARKWTFAGVTTLWLFVGALATEGLLNFYGVVGSRVDCPGAFHALGRSCASLRGFRQYWVGGLADNWYLAQASASPEVLVALRSDLQLTAIDPSLVPRRFWEQPPYWWAPRNGPATRAWVSPGWRFDDRGADGDHYFIVEDLEQGRLFLFLKANL
jgi:hypothetical protein